MRNVVGYTTITRTSTTGVANEIQNIPSVYMRSHCRSRSHRKVSIWAVITLRQSCRKCGCRPKNLNVALVFGLRDLFAGFRRFSQVLQVLQVFAGFRSLSQLFAAFYRLSQVFAACHIRNRIPLPSRARGQRPNCFRRTSVLSNFSPRTCRRSRDKGVTIIVFLKCHCAIDARMPSFARL